MRKLLFTLFCFVFFLFFFVSSSFATNISDPTLSEAVYADLALKGYLDNVSVAFYDGNPANVININEKRHWLPASTVKLFTAMYAYKQIADSKLSPYQYIPVDAKNVVPTEFVSDELPTIQEGDYLTIDRLLRQMVTQSDNTAFNVLLDVLDRNAITDYIHSLGLTHSAIGSKLNLDTSQEQYEFDIPGYGINTTTADDYTKAFTLIWQNRIAGAKPLLEVLKKQKINYMLPLLLPKDVVVAHKTGDLDPLYHDGGVIFGTKNTYVLSIFSNAGDPNLVAHLSELIYTQNYSLVGTNSNNSTQNTTPEYTPSVDPLVVEGRLQHSSVLGATVQPISTQPISAADLGITAKDLSLIQPNITLPKVIIPADSPLHFLIPTWQSIKKTIALNPKLQSQVDIDSMFLQVSEAKDLLSRGKIQQANESLHTVQHTMNMLAQSITTKSDAQTQINLQAISETRFRILGEVLKTLTGTARNKLIKEIGQQARNTLTQVQPNIPLATNATNPSQRPLIGQIIDKTDTSIIVKTAGGQQITIPLTDQSLTVKTKDVAQPTTNIAITETASPTFIPSSTEKPSLASVQVGTTIAMVGSSVGNTFTPTFILTNIPKELAAPEPVMVVKVNKNNRTMVISENGVPVQVNISTKTIIRGTDTDISFNVIKPGDVVIVHGEPLTPITPVKINPSPTSMPVISKEPSSVTQPPTPNSHVSISPHSSAESTSIQKSNNVPLNQVILSSPTLQNQTVSVTQSLQQSQTQHVSVTSVSQKFVTTSSSPQLQQESKTHQQESPQKTQVPFPSQPLTQPKVIQSTSVQIIEKKEDKINTPSVISQPKPEQKPQLPVQEQPKNQPSAIQPNPTIVNKGEDKKK